MTAWRRWTAGPAAAAILFVAAGMALGYTGQVAATVAVAAPGQVSCEQSVTLTATVLDVEGRPVAGHAVAWSFDTREPGDRIVRTPTTTDEHGVATARVSFGAANGHRTIRATTGSASGTVVVTAVCGGLPRTSTLPPTGVPGWAPTALGGLALLGAAAIVARRRRA